MALESYLFFLKTNMFLNKSVYIQGVPNLNDSFNIKFIPDQDNIKFIDDKEKLRFQINRQDLIAVFVEDQATIESRISISRLLLVGVFAFAWKKRKTHPLSFIIFEYKNDLGSNQQMVIQSDSVNSFQFFTNVKYNLYKFWSEADADPGFVNNLAPMANEYKIEQDEGNRKLMIGCLITVTVIVLIILILSK